MNVTRSIRLAALSMALLLVGASSASARTRECVVPRVHGVTLKVARERIARADCRIGMVHRPKIASANEIVARQSPKAGRRIRRGSRVTLWLKAKPVPLSTAAPITTTTPSTTTTPVSTTLPTTVRASLDPDFTQDTSDNLKVTWNYSASAGGSTTLPDGVLSFSVTPATGGLAPVGGCTINVGAITTGGQCTVELQSYGTFKTTVTYTGSGSSVSPSTTTATDTIEPLPVTNTYTWGTDTPTQGAYVHTVLKGDQASVTIGDPNFEGATSVNLTDSTGAQCTAQVSGITATCQMTDIATPSSYTISYPGGTTTTNTVATADNGQQSVTDEWPAAVVQINNPQVAIQQVSLVECGGEAPSASWGNSTNFGCSSESSPKPWPSSVTISARTSVFLDAWAYGSLQDDSVPSGTVNYSVSTGVAGTDYMVEATPCGVQCGYEQVYFITPGTYTVSTSFTSSDPNYPDNPDGPSITVTVVS